MYSVHCINTCTFMSCCVWILSRLLSWRTCFSWNPWRCACVYVGVHTMCVCDSMTHTYNSEHTCRCTLASSWSTKFITLSHSSYLQVQKDICSCCDTACIDPRAQEILIRVGVPATGIVLYTQLTKGVVTACTPICNCDHEVWSSNELFDLSLKAYLITWFRVSIY